MPTRASFTASTLSRTRRSERCTARQRPAWMRSAAAQRGGGPLAAALGGLLDGDEVAALARRARALVRTGRLPAPRGDRAYPWPLV